MRADWSINTALEITALGPAGSEHGFEIALAKAQRPLVSVRGCLSQDLQLSAESELNDVLPIKIHDDATVAVLTIAQAPT